jgi:hypothetical protein
MLHYRNQALTPGVYVYKLFSLSLKLRIKKLECVHLTFPAWSNICNYGTVEHLVANIRLGRNVLSGTNAHRLFDLSVSDEETLL